MKSQDILILLKLISLQQQGNKGVAVSSDRYSARGLAADLGISKTEVNASINRSIDAELAIRDRVTGYPKANRKALSDFIIYGLKYVFPVKPGRIERGIPTAYAAPMLQDELRSTGEFIYVWPDAKGKDKGQSVTPLFKSAPQAVSKDPRLYEYLALVDAIRLGNPRESNLAIKRLEKKLNEK